MSNEDKILQAISSLAQRLDAMQTDMTDMKQEMKQRFDTVDQRFTAVDQRFDTVDQRFTAVDQRFDTVDQRFDAVDQRFDAVDQRFTAVDQRFDNLEGQVRENTDIIKAILHNQEHAHAKLEALETTTATAGSVKRLDTKFDVLNDRLFQQEVDIRQLKVAK